jgi:hypothetical protein
MLSFSSLPVKSSATTYRSGLTFLGKIKTSVTSVSFMNKIEIFLPGMIEHVAGHVEGSGVAVVQPDPVEKPMVRVSKKLQQKDYGKNTLPFGFRDKTRVVEQDDLLFGTPIGLGTLVTLVYSTMTSKPTENTVTKYILNFMLLITQDFVILASSV